jgi:hypothetical protein
MSIITIAELQLHLQQTTTFSDFHTQSAQQCCDMASALVVSLVPGADVWTDADAPLAAKLVALRVAGRLLTNPQQRTSYTGPEGLNYAGGAVRLLTDDERDVLASLTGLRLRTVRMVGRGEAEQEAAALAVVDGWA